MVREDNSEDIIEVIEENFKEDAKDNASEEEDLNENSDEEIYTCGTRLSTKQTMFGLSVTRQLLNSRYE